MTHLLIFATTALLLAGGPADASVAVHAAPLAEFTTAPPQSPFPQDPADSLYRAARTALNQNQFRRAAQLFRQIPARYPRSSYAPDAMYWEAFALYRLGASADLKTALARLDEQRRLHPRAATRGDADALATRIRGTLARAGDAGAAQRVVSDARAAVAPVARQQQAGCPADGNDMRTAALNALLQMDAESAVPVLTQVLARRDACAGPLREQAVFLLAQKRTPETENTLLAIARGDPDPGVREKAVFWLSQVPGERSLEVLQEILRTVQEQQIQEQAIFAIAQQNTARSTQLLRGLAEQRGLADGLREQAIFWLGQHGSAETAAFLRGLYGRLETSALKEKAIFSLAQMGGQGNARWLLEIASNERESQAMREQAIFWAAQSREIPTAELAAFYDRVTSADMREKVIFSLSQRADGSSVDKLIDIARRDPDRDLREQAVFWLGQSRDPRAGRLLLELINED